MPAAATPELRSLTWATDLDALPAQRVFERREGFLAVRSPENPGHYWGNLLMFEDAPRAGDGERWEQLFEGVFADQPRVRHRTFAWDRTDGAVGAAGEEFVQRGYQLERFTGLLAAAREVRAHPRENREVLVRMLDARPGMDAALWEQAHAAQLASRDGRIRLDAESEFRRRRQRELRELFGACGGGCYVALDPSGEELLASCFVVLGGTRASIHDVDTVERHRRRGICSRLLVEAVRDIEARAQPHAFVIAADPDYHALGLYESLGFRAVESCAGVCRMPSDSR